MTSVTDKQNHKEQKAHWPDLTSPSLADLPSKPRLRGKGKKDCYPPDLNLEFCISLATPDPILGHSSSTKTLSDPQTIFTLQENLQFKVVILRSI